MDIFFGATIRRTNVVGNLFLNCTINSTHPKITKTPGWIQSFSIHTSGGSIPGWTRLIIVSPDCTGSTCLPSKFSTKSTKSMKRAKLLKLQGFTNLSKLFGEDDNIFISFGSILAWSISSQKSWAFVLVARGLTARVIQQLQELRSFKFTHIYTSRLPLCWKTHPRLVSPGGGQAPENILGTQGFEWFWAQWNQGAWGWCVGYPQLPRLPQIPRSQGYGPQANHHPWYRGGWVPWKHFYPNNDKGRLGSVKSRFPTSFRNYTQADVSKSAQRWRK